jgi:hypothetical protein
MYKSNLVRSIAFIALFAVFSTTCKDDERLINKYLGRWEFEVINSEVIYKLNSDSVLTSTEDTILYTGVINPGPGENVIMVQYTESLNINLTLDVNGQILTNCLQPSTCHGEFSDIYAFNYFYSSRVNYLNTTTSSSTEINGKKPRE